MASLISFSMSLAPASLRNRKVIPSAEVRPDLVVMLMTPFAARAPYIDAPAAPFTTSTFSMSCELIEGRPPVRMTPSTMYSGSWERPAALIDVGPRRRTSGAAPGRPLDWLTFTPGTRPASWLSGFTAGTGTSERSTRATANVVAFWAVPSITPVTTMSSSRLTSVWSVTSKICSPGRTISVCVCGRKPIIR